MRHGQKIKAARRLRLDATIAEDALWGLLRNRRLKGLKFRRQAPLLIYVVDFLCAEARLVVEIDGAVHDAAHQAMRDEKRDAALEAAGYHVLRLDERFVRERPQEAAGWVAHAASRIAQGEPPFENED